MLTAIKCFIGLICLFTPPVGWLILWAWSMREDTSVYAPKPSRTAETKDPVTGWQSGFDSIP